MNYNEIIINKNKIKYRDEGKGIPILFLPDMTGKDNIWNSQIHDLSNNFKVITLDLSEIVIKSNNIKDFLSIINDFVMKIKIDYFFIVGYNMGAYIAIKFSNAFPEKVFGVAISSLGHISNSDEEKIKYYINEYKNNKGFIKKIINFFSKTNHSNFCLADKFSNYLKNNTIKQELDNLPHPLLIINGEFDHITCQQTASYIYKLKNNCQFEILEQGRKDCFKSNFSTYNEILTNFIKNIKL